MTSRTKKAFKGTITSLLQYSILIVLQVILTPLILKIAGQDVLGAYSIIMQIIGYGILLDLGFSVALSRFLSQAHGLNDQGKRFAEVFTIGRVFLIVTNLVFAGLIFLVALNIGKLMVASEPVLSQARVALCFLAIWLVFRTPVALYNHGLVATQNMAAANLLTIVGNMARLTLSLLMVYVGYGLIGLIVANVLSEAIALIAQMIYFKKKYPQHVFGWKIGDHKLFTNILSFGARYWGVNLAAVIFLGSDIIIVGNLYGATAASIFYTTKIPAFLLIQFIFKISDNASAATNELFAQNNLNAIRVAYIKVLRYSLLLALPFAIGLIGFNGHVITAWVGSGQYAGDIMTMGLAAFALTQVVNHINAMITLAAGDLRRWSVISILTALMSLVLSYWMGKKFGLQWVMVAIAVMDIPNAIFLFNRGVAGLKLTATQIFYQAILPTILVCLPLLIFCIYIKLNDFVPAFAILFKNIFLFFVLWVGCVFFMGLTEYEKQIIKNKFIKLNSKIRKLIRCNIY